MIWKRVVPVLVVVAAFSIAIFLLIENDAPIWLVAFMALVGLTLVALNGRRGRHTPWVEAQERVQAGHAIIFWKPGCIFCERLLRAVGNDNRVTWVNVWVDQDANGEVRRLNDGDELTPTAVVGDTVLRNPSAEDLDEALSGGRRH